MLRSHHIIALLALLPLPAMAGSDTIANTTDVVAYTGNDPNAYFGGSNPYVSSGSIGSTFDTSSMTIVADWASGGNMTLSLEFTTSFPGSMTENGVTTQLADIFLRPGNMGYSSSAFTYGISMGDQSANGGQAAGLYKVTTDATSQQIWSSRSQFVYGGAYTNTTAYAPGDAGYSAYAAPTVITSGHKMANALISTTALSPGLYQVDATVTLTPAEAALFSGGFNVFWGTGDCANGPLMVYVPDIPVMEPASLLLLIVGSGFVMAKRRSV